MTKLLNLIQYKMGARHSIFDNLKSVIINSDNSGYREISLLILFFQFIIVIIYLLNF